MSRIQKKPIKIEKLSPSIEISTGSEASIFHDSLVMNFEKPLPAKKIEIINVCKNRKFFSAFEKEVATTTDSITISVALELLDHAPILSIGGNMLSRQQKLQAQNEKRYKNRSYYIAGLAFAFESQINHTFYFTLQDEDNDPTITNSAKTNFLKKIFARNDVKLVMYDAKEQLKKLSSGLKHDIRVSAKIQDPKIANWLIQPEAEHTIVHMAKLIEVDTRSLLELVDCKESCYSLGLNYKAGSVLARTRSCVEACVVSQIMKAQLIELEKMGKGYLVKYFNGK